MFHWLPLLWRLHLVHHSDTHIDITTSERHHPLDLLLGTAFMMALISVLGLPAQAVGLYLLTATAITLSSHANLRLPASLSRPLSWLLVTPGVHAVHHSYLQAHTDSNYGSVLTLWDRLFGSFVDPEKANIEHFGLDYFHQREDTGLARVLQQPFLFRRDFVYPGRSSRHGEPCPKAAARAEPSSVVMTQGWKGALLGAMTGFALLSLVMWPTVLELTAIWRNNEAYQYAWLVIPMIVYLLGWHHPRMGLALGLQADFTGIFVMAGAAACWGAAALMNIDVGRQFSFILAVQGIAMSALGWRSYWKLFPTLALMFLMVPSGDLLQPALRLLTVKAIELFALVANLPHSVEGFVIFIGSHRYIVVDECSGLAYVTLATFLGYSFGLLLYRSVFKIAALAMLGAFLGVFSNALRVNSIVLIDWVRGSQMELTAHGNLQWIALLMTLVLLFYVLSRLTTDAAPVVPLIPPPEKTDPVRRFAPVLAGLLGLVMAGGIMGLPPGAPRLPYRAQSALLPQNISGWELASPAAAWSVDPQSRTEFLTLTYRRKGQGMQVVIVETLSPTAKLPESRLAPADRSIWREGQVRKETSCVASNCMTLLHATWQRSKSMELRHVYYAYCIGSFITDSRLALRVVHGWHQLTSHPSSPRLIGFILDDSAPAIDDLAEIFRTLQSELEVGNLQRRDLVGIR
ncbi:MAG: archaeosortase/exosortase family protein [Polaromonas sp.]